MLSFGRSLLVDTITPPMVSGIYWLLARTWAPKAGTFARSDRAWINRLTLIVLAVSLFGMLGLTLYSRLFK